MKSIAVLGAGRIGLAISRDLAWENEVTAVDSDGPHLESIRQAYNLNTREADISDPDILKKLLEPFDLVISAMPGFLGFDVLKSIIECGKDVVDISFFSEDPYELDELAKKGDVTAVVDCGVAPGLSNIFLGHCLSRTDVKKFTCYVGGLPVERVKPFEYKAPFSPADVIEEYTRAARIRSAGKEITKEALSDTELLEFEKVGVLEAFNTDGLRTLLRNTTVPDMVEKTLRYPGHSELMKQYRDLGFFSKKRIELGNGSIRPLDLTSKLFFPHWQLKPGEAEFTIMRITAESPEGNHQLDLFDSGDKGSAMSSMARCTGYTCTALVRMIIEGLIDKKGIIAPELIGENRVCFDQLIAELRAKGIQIEIKEGIV